VRVTQGTKDSTDRIRLGLSEHHRHLLIAVEGIKKVVRMELRKQSSFDVIVGAGYDTMKLEDI
jgi:hypothetical protein